MRASPRPCAVPPSIWPVRPSGFRTLPTSMDGGDLQDPDQAELLVDLDHRPLGGEGEADMNVPLPVFVERLRGAVVVDGFARYRLVEQLADLEQRPPAGNYPSIGEAELGVVGAARRPRPGRGRRAPRAPTRRPSARRRRPSSTGARPT